MARLKDVHIVSMTVPVGSKATFEPRERSIGEYDIETPASDPPLSTQAVSEASPNQNHLQTHREPDRVEHGESQETLLLLDGPEAEGNTTPLCKKTSGENGTLEHPDFVETREGVKRCTFLSIAILALSVYSTALSGLWLVVAIIQPHWGSVISSTGSLNPSTANLVTALLAKTIEITFVTVFISFLGQVLTRRSLDTNASGVNLAEITMRSWVVQPGSLITHPEILSSAGLSVLGATTILAAVTSMFFTTASEAMVAPKLKFGHEESLTLSSYVRASYANVFYVWESCKTLQVDNDLQARETCLTLQLRLESYQDLLTYGQAWEGNEYGQNLTGRPIVPKLIANTTLEPSWIETQYSDVAGQSRTTKRIINNATLAWPHPGVATAATSKLSGILQPADLGGIGRYIIKAQVVSPVINALCVDMEAGELAPIVYARWPNARINETNIRHQNLALEDWSIDMLSYSNQGNDGEWLNTTVVDDIFRWGQKYGRRPPIFASYPSDYNLVRDPSSFDRDAAYFLGKGPASGNYTLCELRSWITPKCYTQYMASGVSDSSMQVICSDDPAVPTYQSLWPPDTSWPPPSMDWKRVADTWQITLGFNDYGLDNNDSHARLLTQLALNETSLRGTLPSLAEALVVSASTTVLHSARDISFHHDYERDGGSPGLEPPGKLEAFNATIQTHKYTSGHIDKWHRIFYVILGLTFGINISCLATFIMKRGLVTDITEPQNTFMVALNGPPSERFEGSFETGLKSDHLAVPWRVVPTSKGKYYKIEEVRIEKVG